MAPHRKLRSSGPLGIRTPALATAALTSVTLLSQTAEASRATEVSRAADTSRTADAPSVADPAPAGDPAPSTEEVRKKIDDLYQRAGSATEKHNGAKERTTRQRRLVGTLLGDVAKRTEKLTGARETLGNLAAAQYRNRTGASAPDSASLLLTDGPQDYFDRARLMNRLTVRQQQAAADHVAQRAATARRPQGTPESPETPTATESTLRASKAGMQRKLAEARGILARLTAVEEARLAAVERGASTGTGTGTGSVPGAGSAVTVTTATTATTATSVIVGAKAAEAVAFARAQIGKPCVWGASGPGSYDCSGLTQAAWKAAGVTLPRTTRDQAGTGTTVPVEFTHPGDLVFFHDDISHVGVYIGDGMMIHAPKPGAYVREESIFAMPVHSVVRPA